ncbi:uncharacterized protein C8Q71DRAFT_716279 [Rhodofomes roseus]|uniref:Uncharacterized protein n=1 Tax=Rhodofomes roseus TaxID=34475 RepID=A0ABQ8K259_9APHY|nr:uncharacterized protein C8Q71DRAFT_716279 [Rhodofomes roseus]KAH9830807.1 hypothetical protein C8Q71DRAFT_716279 [Rhodofomes roseus]
MTAISLELEPDSLYICLTQLLVPGFHWGLYFTDNRGVATCHEWAEVQGRRDLTQPVEAYQVALIHPVTVNDAQNRLNLAFVKVLGYSPPSSQYDLQARFAAIEPSGGYSDVRRNRKSGLSCRTWLMRALGLLQEDGVIRRDTPVSNIEGAVKEIGTEVEKRLGEGEDLDTQIRTV